jgi:hypothetical protein
VLQGTGSGPVHSVENDRVLSLLARVRNPYRPPRRVFPVTAGRDEATPSASAGDAVVIVAGWRCVTRRAHLGGVPGLLSAGSLTGGFGRRPRARGIVSDGTHAPPMRVFQPVGRETEYSTLYPVGKEPAVKVETELRRLVPDRLRVEYEAKRRLASTEERSVLQEYVAEDDRTTADDG